MSEAQELWCDDIMTEISSVTGLPTLNDLLSHDTGWSRILDKWLFSEDDVTNKFVFRLREVALYAGVRLTSLDQFHELFSSITEMSEYVNWSILGQYGSLDDLQTGLSHADRGNRYNTMANIFSTSP